jgi:hypothetical protein
LAWRKGDSPIFAAVKLFHMVMSLSPRKLGQPPRQLCKLPRLLQSLPQR